MITCGLNKTNYIINSAVDKEFIIMLDCRNIIRFDDLIMTFEYNVDEVDVLDLSSYTKTRETTAGAINGTDIEITEFIPGQVNSKSIRRLIRGRHGPV